MTLRACLFLALLAAVFGAVLRLAVPVIPVDAEYRAVVSAYRAIPHH